MGSCHYMGQPMVAGQYGNYNPRVCCGCSRLTTLSNYSNKMPTASRYMVGLGFPQTYRVLAKIPR